MQTHQRRIQDGQWPNVPRITLPKPKLQNFLLPDILLQDDFEDSSVDSDEQNKSSWLGIRVMLLLFNNETTKALLTNNIHCL